MKFHENNETKIRKQKNGTVHTRTHIHITCVCSIYGLMNVKQTSKPIQMKDACVFFAAIGAKLKVLSRNREREKCSTCYLIIIIIVCLSKINCVDTYNLKRPRHWMKNSSFWLFVFVGQFFTCPSLSIRKRTQITLSLRFVFLYDSLKILCDKDLTIIYCSFGKAFIHRCLRQSLFFQPFFFFTSKRKHDVIWHCFFFWKLSVVFSSVYATLYGHTMHTSFTHCFVRMNWGIFEIYRNNSFDSNSVLYLLLARHFSMSHPSKMYSSTYSHCVCMRY